MTADRNLGERHGEPDIGRRRTYAAVIGLEVFVIAALWAFGRYFGSL